MELRRELIERGDFPHVRRGLDPEAVSAHLREVAAAVDELKQSRAAADTTADHVRAIVGAAESAATELEQRSRAEAERLASTAKAESESTLAGARTEAETTLTAARTEAETTLTSARNEAETTLTSARKEAETTVASAKAQAEKTISGANAQAEKTVSDANASAQGTLSRAKVESDRMVAEARKEADGALSNARAEAASTRASSRAQAQAHMERVEQAVLRLLERAGVVEGELDRLAADARGAIATLAESVRAGADKLRDELDVPREERASGRFARPVDNGTGADDTEEEPPAAEPAKPKAPPAKPPALPVRRPATPAPPAPAPSAPAAAAIAPAPATPTPAPDQSRVGWGAGRTAKPAASARTWSPPVAQRSLGVGPRLAAFNMALNGSSREDVARHLKAKFGIDDPSEIVDDAFARADI